jgi:hypothetical protein
LVFRIKRISLYLTSVIVLMALFQNCTQPIVRFNDSILMGGTGADGMRYQSYGVCPNGNVGVSSIVLLSPDHSQGALTRQNCSDLSSPQPINPSKLQFAVNDTTVFQLNGAIFNQQTSSSTQLVTVQFCSDANQNVQSLIWQAMGQPALLGSVIQGTNDTGSLNVQQSGSVFTTTTGQSSQFTLTVTGSTGSLNSTIGGQNPVTDSNLACASQSIPAYNDGSQNAPAGPAQYPSLLGAENVRPPWRVAGVDYAVGYPTGQTLKDPTTDPALAANPNVTIDTTNRVIQVNGSNVTLDGYDFTLHGGYAISVNSGSGTVVSNSNVVWIGTAAGSSGLTIENNIFDGTNSPADLALVYHDGNGALVAKYNWFKNIPGSVITDNTGGSFTFEYNLIENAGYVYTQFSGTYSSLIIDYNTTIQSATGAEGFRFYSEDGGSLTGDMSNNTMITSAVSGSPVIGYLMYIGGSSSPVTVTIQNNYMDLRGAAGSFHSDTSPSTNATYSNNVNASNGATLEP